MERNENGLSNPGRDTEAPRKPDAGNERMMENGECRCEGCSGRQLAMVYSPMQCWRRLYVPGEALMKGTLFEELYKPLEEVR